MAKEGMEHGAGRAGAPTVPLHLFSINHHSLMGSLLLQDITGKAVTQPRASCHSQTLPEQQILLGKGEHGALCAQELPGLQPDLWSCVSLPRWGLLSLCPGSGCQQS